MKLSELPIGEKAKILKVNGEGALRDRLLDMGLTPRTEVYVKGPGQGREAAIRALQQRQG